MPQYAAVDIGSNSVRLLVADAAPREPLPQITRLVEERQVTRLGESVFRDGSISDKAMQEVAGVLAQMRETWEKYDVVGARAVATSATRDASNQAEFIKRASEAIGLRVETISGQEEARLIQLGALAVWPHPKQRVLIVDVGGGSAELIHAESGRLVSAFSRPLGAVRLQTAFLNNDPPTAMQLQRLRSFIDEKLAVTLPKLGDRRFDRVIATSSSAAAVVSAVNRVPRAKRDAADRLRARTVEVRRLYKDLIRRDVTSRQKVPGIGPRRAEIIIPGTAVFLAVLETFQLPSLYYCAAGVRQGIVADLALRRVGRELSRLSTDERKVVEGVARRYGVEIRHARKLADFANSLFVALEPLHRLAPNYGKFLEAACYLLDTGHYISDTSHHKHSYYIINNSDLPGFTDSERTLVGMLCRYHRKALPGPRHSEYVSLPAETKKTLALMIPMLRLADGLDRTRDQRVESVSCELRAGSVNLLLRSNMKTDLEQWAVEQVAEPFRQVYDRTLSVSVQRG